MLYCLVGVVIFYGIKSFCRVGKRDNPFDKGLSAFGRFSNVYFASLSERGDEHPTLPSAAALR